MSPRTRPTVLATAFLSMLLVAGLATPGAAQAPAASTAAVTAADPEPTPEPRYRLVGFGTDHGVGLSQRGAAGRAAAGQGYRDILAHYFSRTVIARVPTDTMIRALVVKSYRPSTTQTPLVRGATLRTATDGSGMRWMLSDVTDPALRTRSFSSGSSLVLKGTGASGPWHLQVQDSAGNVLVDFQDTDAQVVIRPVAPKGADDAKGAIRVLIRPGTRYDTYAGSVRIGRSNGRIRVVNVVSIESFVRSVTPQEMGTSNLMDALRAQAVVTRSYFLAGLSPRTGFLAYDVESYRDSQSYKGIKGEKDKTTQAADDTAFEVVAYKGTAPSGVRRSDVLLPDATGHPVVDPAYYVARTFYHAVGGGATEAAQNVFTGITGKPGARTPYLRGASDLCPDPGASDFPNWQELAVPCDETASAFSWSTRSLTLTQLSAILAHDSRTNVGTLTSWPISRALGVTSVDPAIDIWDATHGPSVAEATNRGVSGRLIWVVLRGTRNGKTVTKRVAGWLFKSVFNTYRGSGDPIGSTMIFRTRVP